MPGFTYILSNSHRTVLYIGVTANLARRVAQHAAKSVKSFTSRYNCVELIYAEYHRDIRTAIAREKQLKNWKRAWKLALIRQRNPELKTLTLEDFGGGILDTMEIPPYYLYDHPELPEGG